MKIWREGGKIKKNSTGIIACDDCPCGSCPGCSGMLRDFYKVKLPDVTALGGAGCDNLCFTILDEAEIILPYVGTVGTPEVSQSCNFFDNISGGCPGDLPTWTWNLDISLGISRSWVAGNYTIAFQMVGSMFTGSVSFPLNKTWQLTQDDPFNCNFANFSVPRIGGFGSWCDMGAGDADPVLVSVV